MNTAVMEKPDNKNTVPLAPANSDNGMFFVFVYGTLKQGYWNNRLLETCKFISEGLLPDHKAYYYGSVGSFPFVEENEGTSVSGEVYLINSNTLANLDRLEGYSGPNRHSFYLRKTSKIHTNDGVLDNVYYYCGNSHRHHLDDRMVEVPMENGVYTWARTH